MNNWKPRKPIETFSNLHRLVLPLVWADLL
jgi:hypothetical protein